MEANGKGKSEGPRHQSEWRSEGRSLTRKEVGALGENAACSILIELGYMIRERNWRCRSGELDIVAEQDGRVVFVEVRTRMSRSEGRFGTAAESVDYRKQRQVRETALVYLRSMKLADSAVRFDVIAVSLNEEGAVQSYKHVEAAF